MRDHPGACAGKALGAVLAALAVAHRFSHAAGASGAVRCFHLRQRRGRMRAPLIGRVRAAPLRRHRGEVGCGQERPLRCASAARARVRLLAFHHWAHCGERSTTAAEVVVNGHRSLPMIENPSTQAGRSAAPPLCRAEHHLSGDIGISTALITCLVGPAAHGMTSKSKMSVGSHKVAHAFGMSTTPEMWP